MAAPLLRLNEVMAELSIGRTKARALVWSGQLPVVRIGRAIRVRRGDLDAYIETNLSATGVVEDRPVPLPPCSRALARRAVATRSLPSRW